MSRTLTNKFLMVIAFIGVIVASVLTWEHFHPGSGNLCKAGPTGCDGVLQSAYGKIGFIPTSIMGLGMYLTFLYLGRERGKLLREQAEVEKQKAQAYAEGENASPEYPAGDLFPQITRLNQFLWLMALAAFGISWWLQYTALFYLGAFCPWCFSSALLVSLLFLLTSYDFHFAGKQTTGETKMLIGVSGFIVVLLGFMYGPDVWWRVIAISKGPSDIPIREDFDPNAMVNTTRWWQGDKNAPITVIEFADYMCGNCKDASKTLDEYLKRNPGKIRLGFRNFPVPIRTHVWSRQAAITAEAAGAQGKFWEMHDYLFEHQEEMKKPTFAQVGFEKFAEDVGLDMKKFRKDIADKALIAKVESDIGIAVANGITGTPTAYFIKGKKTFAVQTDGAIRQVLFNPNHEIWQNK